jgi:general stress protein YciG
MAEAQSQGRGWHGDTAGHARAGALGGRKSGGNFKKNPARASLAAKKSGGNFANDPDRARREGQKVRAKAM